MILELLIDSIGIMHVSLYALDIGILSCVIFKFLNTYSTDQINHLTIPNCRNSSNIQLKWTPN